MCILPNYLTCNMDDVIATSARLHPTLFTEQLHRVAKTHRDYAASTTSNTAASIASSMATEAETIAVDMGALSDPSRVSKLSLSERIIAFSIAARLLCVPQSLLREIAARG